MRVVSWPVDNDGQSCLFWVLIPHNIVTFLSTASACFYDTELYFDVKWPIICFAPVKKPPALFRNSVTLKYITLFLTCSAKCLQICLPYKLFALMELCCETSNFAYVFFPRKCTKSSKPSWRMFIIGFDLFILGPTSDNFYYRKLDNAFLCLLAVGVWQDGRNYAGCSLQYSHSSFYRVFTETTKSV